MKGKPFYDRATRLLVIADILVFSAALGASLFIRAQFTNFLVGPIDIAALVPLTVLLRLFTTVIFEHYSLGGTSYLFRDFTSLSIHNLLATGVLLALRFFSHVRYFRLPISAIFIEYVFSTFGMIMIRLVLSRLTSLGAARTVRYRPRVLLWADAGALKRTGQLVRLAALEEFVIRGILTENVMFWDSHQSGIRVFGDESVLSDVLLNDDSLSAVCLLHPEEVTRKRLQSIGQAARAHGMAVCRLEHDRLVYTTEEELLEIADLRSRR